MVKRSRAESSSVGLPWQPVTANTVEGDGSIDGIECAFQLEEMPAGSYDLVPNGAGGFTIRSKMVAVADDVATTMTADGSVAVTAVAGASIGGGEVKKKQKMGKAKREKAAAAAAAAAAVAAPVGVLSAARQRVAALLAEAEAIEAEAEAAEAAVADANDGDANMHVEQGAVSGSMISTTTTTMSKKAARAARLGPRPALPSGLALDESGIAAASSALAAEWAPLGVTTPSVLTALLTLGYAAPTIVQRASITEALLRFKDIVSAAATGSGKTAAYAVPIICRLIERRERAGIAPGGGWSRLAALVVVPTRELAVQVRDHFTALAAGSAVRAVAIVGGLAPEKQDRVLRGRPDVVVATPGRLADVAGSGRHTPFLGDWRRLQFLVLDEADRLVEKGSFPALQTVLAALRAAGVGGGKKGGKGKEGAVGADDIDVEAESVIGSKRAENMKKMAAAAGEGGGGGQTSFIRLPPRRRGRRRGLRGH